MKGEIPLDAIPRISIITGRLTYATQLNIEAWRALFQARAIFHAGCSDDELRWLADFAKPSDIVDLGHGFNRLNPNGLNLHRAMAIRVVVAAQQQGDVVLIESGRADVVELVPRFIQQAATRVRVQVRLIPASPISAEAPLDSVFLHRAESN